MAYAAEIITDSVSHHGDRLSTFEVTFPRMVLAEFNTHRVFSRNSASSRAIPVEKQLGRILEDPFIPVHWGMNQSGMQADAELSRDEADAAEVVWLAARDRAVLGAVALIGGVAGLKDENLRDNISELQIRHKDNQKPLSSPVHKQIANRLLEPFMWHTVIVTATDWSNYFALRANPMAQPEIQRIAYMMQDPYQTNQPIVHTADEWHLPLVQPDEMGLTVDVLKKVSSGRCARVSYLTHDTGIRDIEKDIQLHDTLLRSGHMSPFEHVARPMTDTELRASSYSGNFQGWQQYRKEIAHEWNYALANG